HPDSGLALHELFPRDLGLATLSLCDVSRDAGRFYRELCSSPSRGSAAASGYHSRFQMNSDPCLSCEGIERYLGEEEERVHALRGVSLDIQRGSVHAVVGLPAAAKARYCTFLACL